MIVQSIIYHGLCYNNCGALDGTRNSIAHLPNTDRHNDPPLHQQGRKEMFYLTTHSTQTIYGYIASDIWQRITQISREETRCRHIGYSFRLAARVLLYASSHRQDNTYHGLCYTSRGALAGTRSSHSISDCSTNAFLPARLLLHKRNTRTRILVHCFVCVETNKCHVYTSRKPSYFHTRVGGWVVVVYHSFILQTLTDSSIHVNLRRLTLFDLISV